MSIMAKRRIPVKPRIPPSTQIGNYKLGKKIGEGSMGVVREGRLKYENGELGEVVAIKMVDIRPLDAKARERLFREINIQKLLRHPNIVLLNDVVEENDFVGLVLEYIRGDLFSYILNHDQLTETQARVFMRQIVSALEYMHQNLIIHRDLKLENILLDADCNIKITDFGFSNIINPGKKFGSFIGSPKYAAPEMFVGSEYFGPQVDIFSAGVLLYLLVIGDFPWPDNRPPIVKLPNEAITGFDYSFPEEITLSEECKSLIERMLEIDPNKRASIHEIRHHKWINEGYESPPDSYQPLWFTSSKPPESITESLSRTLSNMNVSVKKKGSFVFSCKYATPKSPLSSPSSSRPSSSHSIVSAASLSNKSSSSNSSPSSSSSSSSSSAPSSSTPSPLIPPLSSSPVVKSLNPPLQELTSSSSEHLDIFSSTADSTSLSPLHSPTRSLDEVGEPSTSSSVDNESPVEVKRDVEIRVQNDEGDEREEEEEEIVNDLTKFEVSVCRVKGSTEDKYGLLFKRVKGDTSQYRILCRDLLSKIHSQ